MASVLLSERRGAALVLTLSDPATRNSLSPEASTAGVEAVGAADSDPEIRVIVLRGEGAHFCGGGNLQRLQATRQHEPAAQMRSTGALHDFVEALRTSPKPTIAAVEGFAAGGGAALALACDLVVAAEDAKFVFSYGRIGLSPDGGASHVLAHTLPRGLALQALWLPEPQAARDWLALGLVHALADSGRALDAALALAERLARMAPNALASAKELVNQAPGRTLREQLDAERDHFVRNLFDLNAGEGIAAFLEKRAPRFA